ncbi:MAG TPA: ATP-dependent helicase C-terminal domain-containing protein, partial [Steroidobacteraceae bacterium]|nr:ATP-dependent helicase C-terminal domain-containing protein [Steroidobacteraceae bacterium]
DPPPAAAFEQARDLLRELGALDAAGRITSHGRRMARLGTHPRLAHMLLESIRSGHARLGAEIAALLSERDLLGPHERSHDVDLRSRLEILQGTVRADTDDALRRRVQRSADLLQRRLGESPTRTAADPALAGQMLASAYPDRIAQSRGTDGRYLLSSGRGAVVTQPQALTRSEYLVVADLDAGGREARIQLAAPVDGEALEALFADRIVTAERIEWNERDRAVVGYRESRLGALVLERRRIEDPDPETVQKALFEGLRQAGLDRLNWSREARALAARVEFVRDVDPDLAAGLPPFDRRSLLAGLEDWLAPWTTGARRLSDLERVDLHAALLARLSWAQRQRLDELAPSHLIVPSGSRLPIDYSGATPVLSARLQELFGMMETPRIADGRVPLMIELLSPARRPVQLTSDLASFWSRTYQEVRRELAGRYPRHYWPEDPLTAEPTARAKPRARRSRGQ